jgi:hypothetical protein
MFLRTNERVCHALRYSALLTKDKKVTRLIGRNMGILTDIEISACAVFLRRLFCVDAVQHCQLLLPGISAQSPGQSAYFAKSSASERIDFSLSSDKPRSSSSLTRPSYKSLPNTSLSCEYR